MDAVHSRYSLQKRVVLEGAGEIEHAISRRIETREELIDDHNDVGLIGILEALDHVLLIALFGAEAPHHPVPEFHDVGPTGIASFLDILVSLAGIRRRYQHFAANEAEFVEETLV